MLAMNRCHIITNMTFSSNILDNQSIPYSFLPSILTKTQNLFLINEIDSLHLIVGYARLHHYRDGKYYAYTTVYGSVRHSDDLWYCSNAPVRLVID